MPAVMRGVGADDGLGADVDEVLVVDGALGEQQAGAPAHPPEAPPAGSSGPIAPSSAAPLPGRVHQPGQRAGAAVAGGSGPSSRRNGRWSATTLRDGPAARSARGVLGTLAVCSPFPRTAAPTPRRRLRASGTERRRLRPPPVPPALRARCRRARPAPPRAHRTHAKTSAPGARAPPQARPAPRGRRRPRCRAASSCRPHPG